jgi:hypothetical protein
MLGHILHDVLDGNVHRVFNDSLVKIADNILDHSKLLEELSSGFQNFMREHVLFTVNPQVWEAFLSRVEYLSQVAKASFLIQHLVGFREIFTIGSGSTRSFENFT